MTHLVNMESSGYWSFTIHSSKTIKSPVAVAYMSSLVENGILTHIEDVMQDDFSVHAIFYWLHRNASYLNFLN